MSIRVRRVFGSWRNSAPQPAAQLTVPVRWLDVRVKKKELPTREERTTYVQRRELRAGQPLGKLSEAEFAKRLARHLKRIRLTF